MGVAVPLLGPAVLVATVVSASKALRLFSRSVGLATNKPNGSAVALTRCVCGVSFMRAPGFGCTTTLSMYVLVVMTVLSTVRVGMNSGHSWVRVGDFLYDISCYGLSIYVSAMLRTLQDGGLGCQYHGEWALSKCSLSERLWSANERTRS